MTVGGRRRACWHGALALLVGGALMTAGCDRRSHALPPQDPAGRAQVLIESGNQAFSAGNYGLAARRYAAAAVIKQDDPAAYYGLGMALSKLGRDEDARAAYARARALSRH
jgi:Flp pilus assembly protein TadD